jgi:CheY-like chemotaxis protein
MNTYCDILIIEDNQSDADLIIRSIQKIPFAMQYHHLCDGEAALDFIFGNKERNQGDAMADFPKLIFLDLKMPKLTGFEVLKLIKSDPLTKKIPIVIFSSSNQEKDVRASFELGANSYVVKPMAYIDFAKVIQDAVTYWMKINQSPN